MKQIYRVFTTLLCLGLVHSALAQESQSKSFFRADRLEVIEEYIQQGMKSAHIPGVAVALIEDGEAVYQRGFGVIDDDENPVSPQTPFQIASVTKTFTALLTVLLEQDGKLSLSDPVVSHIPWFRTSDKSLSDQISIRNLLQHNSGFSTQSGNWTQNSTYRGDDATELSVKKLLTTKLNSAPGAAFEYSNSNYHILSHLIEIIEAKPFEQVMFERILAPLEMENSFVQLTKRETEKVAIGFPHWFGHPVSRPFILGRMKMGDGGMVASAADLSQYIIEVSGGANGLVTRKMRDNLTDSGQNNNSAYGLGWRVSNVAGYPLYSHDGTNGGFNSMIGFSDANEKRSGIGFVILTNSSSALHDRFVWNLQQVILNKEPLPVGLNKTNLISLVSTYMTILILLFFLYLTAKKSRPTSVNIKSFVMPALLLIYSYTMAYTVPAINHINLLSIYPFFPDLATGLIGCALLSLLLAFLMLMRLIRVNKL